MSHIFSVRAKVNFRCFSSFRLRPTPALWLALLFLATIPVSASETDDRYYRIYGIIEQADSLNQGGKVEKAKARYVEAEKALKELRQIYPTYNPKLVAARLTYLADKIAVLSKPPVVAGATNEIAGTTPAMKAAVPGQPQIRLLEAGAEPRKVFRLQARAQDVQKVKIIVRMKMGLVAPELPTEMMTLPPMTLAVTVTTKEVNPEGDAAFEVVIDEAGVLKEAGVAAEAVDAMKQEFGEMKGAVFTGTITDRYFTKKIEVKVPPGTSAEKREGLEQLKDAFANTEFILPEEAIGLGAKWEVKQKTKEQGMTIDETIRHEVVSLDGDTLIVKSSTTQSAANQKIPNPIMPTLKVDMTKMTGTATETATFDLAKTLPIKATVEERSEITMVLNNAGKKQTMTMKSESRSTLESE